MKKRCFFWIPVCMLLLAAGCTAEQKAGGEKPKSVEATPTPTLAPTATPGPNDTGWGEIELNYLHTISGGLFKTSFKNFIFSITWNELKSVWEAKSEPWVAQGEATLSNNGMTCTGSYIADLQMTSGVIMPPNPLKILGECKLVAQFQNQYDAFTFNCDNGVSFENPATTSYVGPITFDLRIGSRQDASGSPDDQWTSIYEYVITKLTLPQDYLLPYCDTSGVLDSRTPLPPDPIAPVLTP